jgi:hypothetical protein
MEELYAADVHPTFADKNKTTILHPAHVTAKESNDDFGLVFQAHDENLLSVRRFDSVLLVGRLAQW